MGGWHWEGLRALSTFLGFSIYAEGEGSRALAVSHTSRNLSDEKTASLLAASPFSLLSHSCLPLLCSLIHALGLTSKLPGFYSLLKSVFPLRGSWAGSPFSSTTLVNLSG